jgi:hypothetical protein
MAYDPELEDEEDDEYFSEVLEDYEPTGREPKFVALPTLDTPPAQLMEMGVDQLVRTYIEERNQLGTDRKNYKAREARIKAHMALISTVLKDKAERAGNVESFSTPFGTAFKKAVTQFRVQDWAALTTFVYQTNNFSILQKRVSPNAVKEVLEADGAYPPGLDVIERTEFAVRVPTARRKKK